MTDVLIKRELLEQVASELEHDNDRYMLGRELRKILTATRQPEGEGLEVVGWRIGFPNNAGWRLYEQRQEWAYQCYGPVSYEVQDLCRLSDAQGAIAELREQRDKWCNWAKELGETSDTLRQQLAERDAAIEEWSGTAVQNGMECDRLTAQRDKLAGLLREASSKLKKFAEQIDGEWGMGRAWDELVSHADELTFLPLEIDAALAEVNK